MVYPSGSADKTFSNGLHVTLDRTIALPRPHPPPIALICGIGQTRNPDIPTRGQNAVLYESPMAIMRTSERSKSVMTSRLVEEGELTETEQQYATIEMANEVIKRTFSYTLQ